MSRIFLRSIIGFCFILNGCKTFDSNENKTVVNINSNATEDENYSDIINANTKKAEVYRNFGTVFLVNATFFSAGFRKAFDERLTELMGVSPFSLGEDSAKTGFFISIFAPDSDTVDLNNRNLWTISLNIDGQTYFPTLVRYLNEKERWKPFFPYLSQWSKEYFIIFDVPSYSANSSKMLVQPKKELKLFNSNAKVSMSW